MSLQELVRILVVWKHDAGKRRLRALDVTNGGLRRMLTGGVAVEHAHDGLSEARQRADVVCGERGAQCRHRVGEAGLMHRDDVHVALGHDGETARGDALLRIIEGEHVLGLVEHARLARVEVLGLGISHHAAAKADAAALLVVDGKHHAVEEAVAEAATARDAKVSSLKLAAREARLLKLAHDGHGRVGIAEMPARADVRVEPTAREVGTRGGGAVTPPAHEAGGERGLGSLERVDHARALGPAPRRTLALFDVDVGSLREEANGVEEVEALALHNVVEHVATRVATETVPQASRRRHVKRRALLVVKRAATPEVATPLPEHNGL